MGHQCVSLTLVFEKWAQVAHRVTNPPLRAPDGHSDYA